MLLRFTEDVNFLDFISNQSFKKQKIEWVYTIN